MIFYVASAILTNGRYPYIYSSAVVNESASNRFTNCHTYYFLISGQKLKTYQSSDWKNTNSPPPPPFITMISQSRVVINSTSDTISQQFLSMTVHEEDNDEDDIGTHANTTSQ